MRLDQDLINAGVLGVFASSCLFIIVYTALARWWKSSIGIALVTMDGGIAVALVPGVLKDVFRLNVANSQFYVWLSFVSLLFVMGAVNWRTLLLARQQLRYRGDVTTEKDEENAGDHVRQREPGGNPA